MREGYAPCHTWSSCHIDDEHIRRGLGLQETHARMPHRSTPRRHHRHRASGWFRRLAPRFVLSAEQLGPAWLTHWHSCWLCKRERALAVSAGDSCARVTCHAWPRGKIQSSSAILSSVQKNVRDDLMSTSGPASCRNTHQPSSIVYTQNGLWNLGDDLMSGPAQRPPALCAHASPVPACPLRDVVAVAKR